ncbi:myb-like protein P isoform X1 [Vespula maculifrons]|uniref:Uncharacterized protein n=2 Tax=Vespula TaxID=7451 RepID=A0A834JSE5_VESVU|nr:hypothetical protein HZH66_009083 [Vespula vulgaris]
MQRVANYANPLEGEKPFSAHAQERPCKVWLGDSEVAWRTEQSFKRTSPLNPCATTTTTTTTTTGGGAPIHPHLSPPIAAPVTTPDHRSPTSLHAKLAISPDTDFNSLWSLLD